MRDNLYIWPLEHDRIMSEDEWEGLHRIEGLDPTLLSHYHGTWWMKPKQMILATMGKFSPHCIDKVHHITLRF